MFERPTSRQLVFCNPLIEDLLLHILAEEKLSHIFSRSTFKTLFEHSVLIYSLLKLYFSEKQISRVPKFSEINFPNFSWEVDKKSTSFFLKKVNHWVLFFDVTKLFGKCYRYAIIFTGVKVCQHPISFEKSKVCNENATWKTDRKSALTKLYNFFGRFSFYTSYIVRFFLLAFSEDF